MRRWPRSLTGQLLLLVAGALFAAQAINFALLLNERRGFRFEQVVGPAVTRITDALEREAAGRPLSPDRGRVRLVAADPIAPGAERRPEIARALARALRDAGVEAGRIDTGVAAIDRRADWLRRLPPREAERLAHGGRELQIAVERPGGRGWLVQSAPWPRGDLALVWRLIAQTLVLYAVVLAPVLWIGRRVARPLASLAAAARDFAPGQAAPLAASGPPDVRALIASFNALRLRVTAMLDEKDRMLGAIGHDLRTPLAALRVRIESVEDDVDRARMSDTVAEMNRTLDDILSLARVGRPSEPPTEVDVTALVDAVVEDFRDLGEPVEFADSARLPLRLRPAMMRRAVRNLIENAVKYGGGAEVCVRDEGRAVAIEVADRGPGIPADRLEAVFDPFTRLEGSRNRDTGGIGLGLALARAIVGEAGGDIRLTNRAGGGLLAAIALPRR